MASGQEVEMLRRQLDELTAQMIEIRQPSSNTAMNAAVTRLAELETTVSNPIPLSSEVPDEAVYERRLRVLHFMWKLDHPLNFQ